MSSLSTFFEKMMLSGDVDYNENIRFHIDILVCKAGVVTIKGWLLSELTVIKLYLIDENINGPKFALKSYGLPSFDVSLHYGPIGAKSRFFEEIFFPEELAFQPSALLVRFQSGLERTISFKKIEHNSIIQVNDDKPRTLKLGVGITTYRRRELLERLIKNLMLHTKHDFELIVADDGSNDDTLAALQKLQVSYITGNNRGVAWNKNRALYYLNNRIKCDIIILLEDDTIPSVDAWEQDWIEAALKYGHINLAGHWFKEKFFAGHGTPASPISCFSSSGQCVAFSRKVIERIGFFDSRFGRYGFEHVEHSQRCIRFGFGGIYQPSNPDNYIYFLIRGGLTVGHLLDVHGDDITLNATIYNSIKNDQAHRWAWRGDEQMVDFLEEQDSAVLF